MLLLTCDAMVQVDGSFYSWSNPAFAFGRAGGIRPVRTVTPRRLEASTLCDASTPRRLEVSTLRHASTPRRLEVSTLRHASTPRSFDASSCLGASKTRRFITPRRLDASSRNTSLDSCDGGV